MRAALEAAGFVIEVDMAPGSAFAVELPSSSQIMNTAGLRTDSGFSSGLVTMLDPGETPGTNTSSVPPGTTPYPRWYMRGGTGRDGPAFDDILIEPTYPPPPRVGAAVPQALKTAMATATQIPGVTSVKPDKQLYLVQTEPQAVCTSSSADTFVSSGTSVEWLPYGLSRVQALDSTITSVSSSVASKVRGSACGLGWLAGWCAGWLAGWCAGWLAAGSWCARGDEVHTGVLQCRQCLAPTAQHSIGSRMPLGHQHDFINLMAAVYHIIPCAAVHGSQIGTAARLLQGPMPNASHQPGTW